MKRLMVSALFLSILAVGLLSWQGASLFTPFTTAVAAAEGGD